MAHKVSTPSEPYQSLSSKILVGAAWSAAMRWGTRVIGLINTLVLVRLLTPEDFGVIAMAMIVVAFVNAFNDIGLDLALIRTPHITDSHYYTAWTLTALLGALNSAILFLLAPIIADFYEDPRLLSVMYVMAALPLISGLSNVRLADFRRDLHFAKDFKYIMISRAVSLPVSIALALYFRNYWALVFGMLAQKVIGLIVGYLARPFRPKISFAEFRELFVFSVWVQVRSVGQALTQRLDQLFVGKLLGSRELGGYHISQEITEMATHEIVLPLGRALLPGYSRILEEKERLRSAFYKVLGLHIVLGMALAGGLYAVSPNLVLVLLGDQWAEFTTVFQILALAGGVSAVTSATGPLLIALDRVRTVALSVWARLMLSIIALTFVAVLSGGVEDIALTRLLTVLILLFLLLRSTISAVQGEFSDILGVFFRTTFATGLMVFAINNFGPAECCPPWLQLILDIPMGALVYVICLYGLWWISGRPDGVEKEILHRLSALFTKRSNSTARAAENHEP